MNKDYTCLILKDSQAEKLADDLRVYISQRNLFGGLGENITHSVIIIKGELPISHINEEEFQLLTKKG